MTTDLQYEHLQQLDQRRAMWANLVLADLAAGKHVDPHDIAIVRWKELTAERDRIVATFV